MRGLFAVIVASVFVGVAGKSALVLGGGGAKGAYAVGALKAMCAKDSTIGFDMILGTSIGALNAGFLAQYNKNEFCSKGVPAMENFWRSIHSQQDVFKSTSHFTSNCFSALSYASDVEDWTLTGGLCDSSPGNNRYKNQVNADRIRRSNVELHVPASDLANVIDAQWFSDQSPHLLDSIIASGSISPLFAPMEIEGSYYVDGGIFHNVPVSKAVDLGATDVSVVMLNPINNFDGLDTVQDMGHFGAGKAILEYYYHVVDRRNFIEAEFKQACLLHPTVPLMGIAPDRVIGGLTDFSSDKIPAMIDHGYQNVMDLGLEDFCKDPTIFGDFEKSLKAAGGSTGSSDKKDNDSFFSGHLFIGLVCGSAIGCAVTVMAAYIFISHDKRRAFMKVGQSSSVSNAAISKSLLDEDSLVQA